MTIDEVLKDRSGIMLDIGCGEQKQDGYVGMDVQPLPGVDIIHDINVHPWPLPDESVTRAIASHLVEHIPPVAIGPDGTWFPFVEFMNEVWRILKVGSQFVIACPHGASKGYLQDPTHCNSINETTWSYFDPDDHKARGALYPFYRPKPWRIQFMVSNPAFNMEIVLIKREDIDRG